MTYPKGTLYIVSTPIGNLEDITLRALRILGEVALIFAEDTRRTRKLLSHYQIHVPMVSCNQENQISKGRVLTEKLESGLNVALVSDAGTPGISDPGSYFSSLAVNHGFDVIPVPGVSAVITALSVSGLPADSFCFFGFLPRHSSKRKAVLEELRHERRTIVIYESPKRLQGTLRDLLEVLGDRKILFARELTKVFEELRWGFIGEIIAYLENKEVKGEITLVLEGMQDAAVRDTDDLPETIEEYCRTGLKLSEIARRIAREFGIPKSEAYKLCLQCEKKIQDK